MKKIILLTFIAIFLTAGTSCKRKAGENTSQTYTVEFIAEDGMLIDRQEVPEGKCAILPLTPDRIGYRFREWAGQWNNVLENRTVVAMYDEIKSYQNVLYAGVQYVKKNEKFTIPIVLAGNVCISAMDIYITFDSNLIKFDKVSDSDNSVITNYVPEDNRIYANLVSAQNITGEFRLCNISFIAKDVTGSAAIEIFVKSAYCYDEDIVHAEYKVYDGQIIIWEMED